jgi:ribonucleoside-diphosphate reductase beta chain
MLVADLQRAVANSKRPGNPGHTNTNIFEKRVAFKPFEYPEVIQYKQAINHSYWLVSEWTFMSDVDDFHVRLTPVERSAVKNALLAISQIEVAVKKFWGRLGDRLPKPEFEQVGISFAESEIRHADAYSHLLEVLGLNADFERLLTVPAIRGRVDYLGEAVKAGPADQDFASTLALFSLFVENVSLFGQFLVVKSINKHRNLLKDIDNVIQATQLEERLHALFGAHVVNLIRRERPEWFGPEFYERVEAACRKAYRHESAIVDWIYEGGELPYLPAVDVREFLKARFNESLEMVGGKPIFDVDGARLEKTRWFVEETLTEAKTDFFHKRPVSYAKFSKPITAEDLF